MCSKYIFSGMVRIHLHLKPTSCVIEQLYLGQEATRKKRRSALTIHQKLEIVDFALELIKEARGKVVIKRKRNPKKAGGDPNRPGVSVAIKKYKVKGLNLQAKCLQHFPHLEGVKVTQLIAQAEIQKWRSLSPKQQMQYRQLPDSVKLALGISNKVRGWKCLRGDHFEKTCQEKGRINRWKVPSSILEDWVRVHVSYLIGRWVHLIWRL